MHEQKVEKETPVTALTETGARKAEEPGGTSKRRENHIIVASPGKLLYRKPRDFTVSLYEGRGALTHARCRVGNPDGKGRGERKPIMTFSPSSRRNLRRSLLCYGPPEGWSSCDVTFTIPGPVLPLLEAKKLWVDYCREVLDYGWMMVWRIEIQARGALHWHTLISMPFDGWQDFGAKTGLYDDRLDLCIKESWRLQLDRLGPVTGLTDAGVRADCHSRRFWPGADEHDVTVAPQRESSGTWLRYLSDHASKSKQAQIAVGIGRHWGWVGRKHRQPLEPDLVVAMTGRQYWAYLRAKQRLATPRMECSKAPFGRRLGYRVHRGQAGKSVWFGRCDTFARIIDWARVNY